MAERLSQGSKWREEEGRRVQTGLRLLRGFPRWAEWGISTARLVSRAQLPTNQFGSSQHLWARAPSLFLFFLIVTPQSPLLFGQARAYLVSLLD